MKFLYLASSEFCVTLNYCFMLCLTAAGSVIIKQAVVMLSSQTCSNTSSMSKLERDLSLISDIDKLVTCLLRTVL